MSSDSDFPWEAVPPASAATPGEEIPSEDEVDSAPARKAASRKAAPRKAAPRKAAPRKAAAAPVEVAPEPSSYEILRQALVPETTVLPARSGRSRGARAAALTGIALLLAGASGFGAAAWNESKPDTYASTAVLLIDQEPALTYALDEGLVTKLGALRFKYAGEVTTEVFADEVSGSVAIPAAQVSAALSVRVDPGTLLFSISATSTDKTLVQRLAQAAAQTMSDDVATAQHLEGVRRSAFLSITVVSPAGTAVHVSPSRKRSLELGGGAFAAVLLGAALLRDLTRRRPAPDGPGA